MHLIMMMTPKRHVLALTFQSYLGGYALITKLVVMSVSEQ